MLSMRWLPQLGARSNGSGRCRRGWWPISRSGWRCIRKVPTRTCSRNSPMVCRGLRVGSSRGLHRRNRRSFKHVHDWGTNPCAICSPASLALLPVRHARFLLAGRRLVAIDGTCVDVPDTPENADFFGAHHRAAASSQRSRKRGCSRWPNAAPTRCSMPWSAVSHLGDRDAQSSQAAGTRNASARRPRPLRIQALESGRRTGADLLWRVKTTLRPRHVETLPDGRGSPASSRPRPQPREHTAAQCPSCRLHDRRLPAIPSNIAADDDSDPDQASATELPALTRSVGKSRASSTNSNPINAAPGGAALEIPRAGAAGDLGHLRRHYAIRTLMLDAATHAGTTPIEILRCGATYHPKSVIPQLFFPLTTVTLSAPSGSAPSGNSPNASIHTPRPGQPAGGQTQGPQMGSKRTQHTRWPQPARSPQITIRLLTLA